MTGANQTDRAKYGANRHDMMTLGELLDAMVIEQPPPPARAARHLCLDRGYDYDACREAAAERGYRTHIPRRRATPRATPHGAGRSKPGTTWPSSTLPPS